MNIIDSYRRGTIGNAILIIREAFIRPREESLIVVNPPEHSLQESSEDVINAIETFDYDSWTSPTPNQQSAFEALGFYLESWNRCHLRTTWGKGGPAPLEMVMKLRLECVDDLDCGSLTQKGEGLRP